MRLWVTLVMILLLWPMLQACTRTNADTGPGLYSVRLRWDAPQFNVDGSPCTDLAGYRVHIATQPGGPYGNVYDTGSTETFYDISLPAGYFCFVVTAYDKSGNESEYSNEVCKELGPPAPDDIPPNAPLLKEVKDVR